MFKRENEKATVGTHEEAKRGQREKKIDIREAKQSHETFSGIFTLPWM